VTTLPIVGELSAFWLGFLGSAAVEVAAAVKSCADLDGHCPERYKRPFYLFVRVLLAIVAGSLPVVLEASNALTSFYMGASAPLLLDRLGKGIKPDEEPK